MEMIEVKYLACYFRVYITKYLNTNLKETDGGWAFSDSLIGDLFL